VKACAPAEGHTPQYIKQDIFFNFKSIWVCVRLWTDGLAISFELLQKSGMSDVIQNLPNDLTMVMEFNWLVSFIPSANKRTKS